MKTTFAAHTSSSDAGHSEAPRTRLQHSRSLWLIPALFATLISCTPSPSLYVQHMRVGKKAAREEGAEDLKVTHVDGERFGSANPGYYIVKSESDWAEVWAGSSAKPPMPQVDFDRKMLLVAATDSVQTQTMRVTEVQVTGTSVHAYVTEVRPGEGCPPTSGGIPKQDFAYVDRTEKPVHFHVEPELSRDCGGGPEAVAQCHLVGSTAAAPEIEAAVGQTVECDAKLAVRGTFAAVDQRWYFGELPPGSASKMTFSDTGRSVSFPVDIFGHFMVRFEVIDDVGRKGVGQAGVNVSPPKDGLYLRLGWTEFGPTDDPDTFPRTELELTQGAESCTVDAPKKPAWCEIKSQGHATQVKVPLSHEAAIPIHVKYIDDRFVGGPVACVKVILNGKETATVCDKEGRKADEIWTPGALIPKSGTVEAIAPVDPPPTTKPPTTKPPTSKPPTAKPPAWKPPAGAGTKAKPPVGTGTKPKPPPTFTP